MLPPDFSQVLRLAIFDIRIWQDRFPDFDKHESATYLQYMKCLLELADGPTSDGSETLSEWLIGLLLSGDEDYDSSLALFKEDPNTTTLAISDGLTKILEIIVAKRWREVMDDDLAKRIREDKGFEMEAKVRTNLLLEQVLPKMRYHPRWLSASKVNRLCLRAGSASTSENAFKSLEALREMAIQHSGRETELLAEIKLLKKSVDAKEDELKQQRRIIEDLAYRHIMENIIDPQKWTGNYGQDWRTFWNDAVNNAISGPSGAPRKPSSPLAGLVNQFGSGSIGSIKATGGTMYGTVSTTIHHYGDAMKGVYKIQCQRDKLPEEIMKALEPLPADIQNGKVSWQAERQRFL